MPYKARNKQRHKFKKKKYKITNWTEYNESLKKRGDLTIWFTESAIANWIEPKRNYSGRGRPKSYSNLAVETSLFIRQVYHLPLRQTEGFIRSIIQLLKLPIKMMEFSNISKRCNGLKLKKLVDSLEPGSHVLVDSSGLKVFGKDEWHQEKHKVKAKRTWRKLHIAIDEKHQFLACKLTTKEVGDPSVLPNLLADINDFDTFMADGAYDGEPSYRVIQNKSPQATIVIPPPHNAVSNHNSIRNEHIDMIHTYGRMGWQRRVEYGLRSLVELAILRYKTIIGRTMKARQLPQQEIEAEVSARVLNRMTQLGMPVSIMVA